MNSIFIKKTKDESATYNTVSSLSHTKWNCKYHIVFTPKYRRKIFYGQKRMEIGNTMKLFSFATQSENKLLNVQKDCIMKVKLEHMEHIQKI